MAKKPAKLPVTQLVVLSLCRFAEPVALTSVFPYLPEMIESFDVNKTEVAGWAGVTSAVFSIGQALTGIAWGRASDHYGRKATIMAGLSLTMCASLLFGFSRSLPLAIVARAMAGASSGTVGITRTAVAEMVSEKELQPRAFSVMPLVWSIGSIIGPTIGGALANPVKMYPGLFGNSTFFKAFPFLLPNLVASSLFLIGLFSGIFFLKETLETKRNSRDYGLVLAKLLTRPFRKESEHHQRHDAEEDSLLRRKSSAEALQKPTRPCYREVFTPQSNLNLLAYTLLAMHSIAFDQILPVFLHLPPQENRATNPDVQFPLKFAGGFGLNSGRIGFLFTMYAVIAMLVQFLVFPPMAHRYGVHNCFKFATLGFPIAYFLAPFTVLFPTPNSQQTAIFCVMILKCFAGVFAFPCTTIMLTNSASSLRILGTLNGVSVSISAIGRALGPGLAGGAFTLGIRQGYVILPWWLLTIFGLMGHASTFWLVEKDRIGDAAQVDLQGPKDGVEETQPLLGAAKLSDTRGKYLACNDEPLETDVHQDETFGYEREEDQSVI